MLKSHATTLTELALTQAGCQPRLGLEEDQLGDEVLGLVAHGGEVRQIQPVLSTWSGDIVTYILFCIKAKYVFASWRHLRTL